MTDLYVLHPQVIALHRNILLTQGSQVIKRPIYSQDIFQRELNEPLKEGLRHLLVSGVTD